MLCLPPERTLWPESEDRVTNTRRAFFEILASLPVVGTFAATRLDAAEILSGVDAMNDLYSWFEHGGWFFHWTGWKTSADSLACAGQWAAAKGRAPNKLVIASYPGETGLCRPGDTIFIGNGCSIKWISASAQEREARRKETLLRCLAECRKREGEITQEHYADR